MSAPKQYPDAGWRTTEFWVTIIGTVGALVLIGLGRVTIEDILALWPIFAAVGGYALSRGIAKM